MLRTRLGLLVALFASALALRPQLVGVGPLLPEIQDDLAVSHAVAGLLGTIPVLCMGLFAPPAPYLSSRLGSRYAIAACIAAIAVFGIARALAPSAAAVILLTVPVGVGIGFAGALLPVAVKERFPHRPAFATGIYATGINLGSATSASVAVPIAGAAGGWRAALLAFSIFAALLVVLWLALTRHERAAQVTGFRPPRPPLRSRIAWLLAGVFCLMAVVFYGLNAWLPDVYVERGWSEGRAGGLVAVMNIASLPTTLLIPWLADRYGSRRLYLVASSGLMTAALLGIVLVPDGAWAWVWAAVTGVGIGAQFPLVLTLPLDVADRPDQVGAVAGLMLGAGYAFSAVAPFGLGAIRDAAGDYTSVLWVIVAASAGTVALVAMLSPARLRHRHAGA
ncbi:MAG: MFS transporter [Thermoleophilia bacterium]|nr:MFS transporter [Thermoleophilia bacterium]